MLETYYFLDWKRTRVTVIRKLVRIAAETLSSSTVCERAPIGNENNNLNMARDRPLRKSSWGDVIMLIALLIL